VKETGLVKILGDTGLIGIRKILGDIDLMEILKILVDIGLMGILPAKHFYSRSKKLRLDLSA